MLDKSRRTDMKLNFFAVLAVSLFLFACILPSGSSQPEAAPTFDVGILSTNVAQTANAAASQTQAGITPTLTISPTETRIPSTATLAPPTPILPTEGTFLSKQDNGTIQFFDQTAGYELILPTSWIAIRVKGPEYFEAIVLEGTSSAEFQSALKNTQKQNGDVFRLFAFNLKANNVASSFIMNMNFVWDQQDTNSLSEAMKKIESQYPKIFPGIQITYLGTFTTPKNVQGGVIESTWVTKNSAGQDVSIFQKQAIFKLRTGTLALTLSVPSELKELPTQDFDFVISNLIVK